MLSHLKPNRRPLIPVFLIASSLLLSGYLFLLAFRLLPVENTSLGLDWRTIWEGIRRGQVAYGNPGQVIGGLYTPPWGIWLLLPLGYLTFKDSWGLFSFISTLLLILSVPRLKNQRLDVIAILLLALSFPALRNLADGNLEALVIAGILLLISGYNQKKPLLLSIGLLLATVKFQETWLLAGFMLVLIIKHWSKTHLLKVFLLGGGVASFSMLIWGGAWLRALFGNSPDPSGLSSAMGRGSIIDISLAAALTRLGSPAWLTGALWFSILLASLILLIRSPLPAELDWRHATFLVAASMLLAPYISGDSILTLAAIGIIPLFQERRLPGLGWMMMLNLPFLVNREMMYHYSSYYWTALALILWLITWRKIAYGKSLSSERQPSELHAAQTGSNTVGGHQAEMRRNDG